MKPIVAIIGRPNVGKSTLFNRIVGGRLAITHDTAGVTRDRHYREASWEGRQFLCVDTGGLYLDEKGGLEKKIRGQVDLAIEEATLLLFVLNSQEGLIPEEREMVQKLRRFGKKFFLVVNKIDTPNHEGRLSDFYPLGDTLYPVSAEHGYRVNDLLDEVVQGLPPIASEETRKDSRIKVALIGRPNVGKSSLLNRLLGEERVVVHEEGGTTRDVVDTPIQIGKKDYLLIDTAGIRKGGRRGGGRKGGEKTRGNESSQVERVSVLNALKAIGRSDICLLLLDATEGIHKQDAHVAGEASRKGLILLWNKWDLVNSAEKKKFIEKTRDQLKFLRHVPILFLSALTGEGCEKIWPAVDQLYKASGRRISTSTVNEVFESLVGSHNPPHYKGKPIKFFYATQTAVFPPTFVIFVSEPTAVHFSFKRYLINHFREAFQFHGAPVEIIFRKKR